MEKEKKERGSKLFVHFPGSITTGDKPLKQTTDAARKKIPIFCPGLWEPLLHTHSS